MILNADTVLEQPIVPFFGESRYLTSLWVSANADEPRQSDSSQSVTVVSKMQSDSLYHQEIKYRIREALKLLSFREQHVLVQFWSPRDVGKQELLTTINQPFGVGVVSEELCFYRRDSERNVFHVDMNHEENLNPPARVFMRRLPEWTCDLTNYNTKDFPQQDCAIRCNLRGYLALPVFDPNTGLCVGVLELLTSSKHEDFAYEVKHIHQELKMVNLTSPQVFYCPVSNVLHERNKTELDKIFSIMKVVCDTHSLPLAQTWTVSPSASYVAHEKVFQKACSSYNTRCFRKNCMSTALPCYVRDLSVWPFLQANKVCHLEKSRGVAGRALSSRGSCFCGDVTRLDEEEYPLVHYASKSRLTGCFAIFLHGVDDYVLEFFLPSNIKDSRDVLYLVQTINQSIQAAYGFELGDWSDIEVTGPPADLSSNMIDLSDFKSIVTDTSEPDYANVMDQLAFTNDSIEEISDNFTAEKSDLLKQVRKRQRDSDTVPSPMEVMVNVSFSKRKEQFTFPLFHGLSKLKNEVAKRFKLKCQRLRLKYTDEDGDLILICLDDDLKSALDASGCMNLICLEE